MAITDDELRTAKDSSGFVRVNDSSIVKNAYLLYAIMAKRAINIPDGLGTFDSCTDYNNALLFLHGKVNNGVNTQELPQLLGLKKTPAQTTRDMNFVLLNLYHAVCASYNIFDDNGRTVRFNIINFRLHFGWAIFSNFRFTRFKLIDGQ